MTRPRSARRPHAWPAWRAWRWLASGCVGIPDEGPVVESQADVAPSEELGYYNDPPAPTDGEPPTDIVKGFLDAQAAIPVQTNTAEQFLTSEEAATWRPRARHHHLRRRVVPAGEQPGVGRARRRQHARQPRGSWRGPLPAEEPELSFTHAAGGGRVADRRRARRAVVPDDVVRPGLPPGVAATTSTPRRSILVPEPVYVPRGDQLASALVDAPAPGPIGPGAGGRAQRILPAGLERGPVGHGDRRRDRRRPADRRRHACRPSRTPR